MESKKLGADKDSKTTMKMTKLLFTLIGATSIYAQELTTFAHPGDLDSSYQSILNQIKKDGLEVESASNADSPSQTTVRVAVYEESATKGKTEPWSTPKINTEQSQAEATKLKQEASLPAPKWERRA